MPRSFNSTSFGVTPRMLRPGNAVSFIASVKTTQGTTGSIFGMDNGSGSGRVMQFRLSGGKLNLIFFNTSVVTVSGSSTTSINDGVWHRCIAVCDGVNIRGYVDANLEITPTPNGTITSFNGSQLNIGQQLAGVSAADYVGLLGECAYISRALTHEEALTLGRGAAIQSVITPDHYWPLAGAAAQEPDFGVLPDVAKGNGPPGPSGERVGRVSVYLPAVVFGHYQPRPLGQSIGVAAETDTAHALTIARHDLWLGVATETDAAQKLTTPARIRPVTETDSALPLTVSQTIPSTPVLDDFNRADESPLSDGGNWHNISVESVATLAVVSNTVQPTSSLSSNGFAWWTPASFGSAAEAYFTVTTLPGGSGYVRLYVALSMNTFTQRGYFAQWSHDANGLRIFSTSSPGVSSVIAQAASARMVAGDVVTLRVVGDYVGVYRNGSLVLRVMDTTYRGSFQLGIGLSNAAADNFGGGSVGSHRTLGVASETDTAQPLSVSHTAPTLGVATETDTAQPLTPSQTIPTAPVLDNFNRANENPLSGGGNWTKKIRESSGTIELKSNAIQAFSATGTAYWTPSTFSGNPVEVFFKCSTAATASWIRLYLVTNVDTVSEVGYMAQLENGAQGFRIFQVTAPGTFTQIAQNTSARYTAGDVLTLRIAGDTVALYKNGTQVLSVVDTTYRGAFSLAIAIGTVPSLGGAILDDFGGGGVPLLRTLGVASETDTAQTLTWTISSGTVVTSSDTFTLTEVVGDRSFTLADTFTLSEILAGRDLSSADTASLAETEAAATLTPTDKTSSDSGALNETFPTSTAADEDVLNFSDAGSVADLGAPTDKTGTDSGTFTDSEALSAQVAVNSSDSGALTDTGSVTDLTPSEQSDADAATFAETWTLLVQVAVSDGATFSESDGGPPGGGGAGDGGGTGSGGGDGIVNHWVARHICAKPH